MLSYETPTCKRELTKLENLKKKKKKNYGQCTKHSKQHTSTIFTMIHVISLPSRSELSHLAVPQQITEMPAFWYLFVLIASVGKNYESFLYFSPHGDQS